MKIDSRFLLWRGMTNSLTNNLTCIRSLNKPHEKSFTLLTAIVFNYDPKKLSLQL